MKGKGGCVLCAGMCLSSREGSEELEGAGEPMPVDRLPARVWGRNFHWEMAGVIFSLREGMDVCKWSTCVRETCKRYL